MKGDSLSLYLSCNTVMENVYYVVEEDFKSISLSWYWCTCDWVRSCCFLSFLFFSFLICLVGSMIELFPFFPLSSGALDLFNSRKESLVINWLELNALTTQRRVIVHNDDENDDITIINHVLSSDSRVDLFGTFTAFLSFSVWRNSN